MELWSLLNLLLPEVFDDHRQFTQWFSDFLDQAGAPLSQLLVGCVVGISHANEGHLNQGDFKQRFSEFLGQAGAPACCIVVGCCETTLHAVSFGSLQISGQSD